MKDEELSELVRHQDGVLSRSQAAGRGWRDHDLRRLVRRRELVRMAPGVYVNHTGQPTWNQQAWAAVLGAAPAALSGASALTAWGVHTPGDPGARPIEIAIDHGRRIARREGVTAVRVRNLEGLLHPSASPPRVRLEHAALTVASGARVEMEAISLLADVVQSRRTTPARLTSALGSFVRMPRRQFLRAVLADLDQGAWSSLEVAYLRSVERAHALPRADRQLRAAVGGVAYRDVAYTPYGLLVELDGRLFHDDARSRDRDLGRDLRAAVDGWRTVRLGWGQVLREPCQTAVHVGHLLRQGGWEGRPSRCPACP